MIKLQHLNLWSNSKLKFKKFSYIGFSETVYGNQNFKGQNNCIKCISKTKELKTTNNNLCWHNVVIQQNSLLYNVYAMCL